MSKEKHSANKKEIKELIEFVAYLELIECMEQNRDKNHKELLKDFYNKIEIDKNSIVRIYNEFVKYYNNEPQSEGYKLNTVNDISKCSKWHLTEYGFDFACSKIKQLDSEGNFEPFLNSIKAFKNPKHLENLDAIIFGNVYPIKEKLEQEDIDELKGRLKEIFKRDDQFVDQLIEPILEYRAATVGCLNKRKGKLGHKMTPEERKYYILGIVCIIVSIVLLIIAPVIMFTPVYNIGVALKAGLLIPGSALDIMLAASLKKGAIIGVACVLSGISTIVIGPEHYFIKVREINEGSVNAFINPKNLARYISALIESNNLNLSESQLQNFIRKTKGINSLKEFYEVHFKNSEINMEFIKNNQEIYKSVIVALKTIVDSSKDAKDFNNKSQLYIEVIKDYQKIVEEINKSLEEPFKLRGDGEGPFSKEQIAYLISNNKLEETLKEIIVDAYTYNKFMKVSDQFPNPLIDKFKELVSKESYSENEIKQFAKECEQYVSSNMNIDDISNLIIEARERIGNCNNIIAEAKQRANARDRNNLISDYAFKELSKDLVALSKSQEVNNQK
ncbi:MAG: hypothetical protein J0H68_08750 [Sphingobacteriia bacterium]|nr:hypothetical protein [Sphingobacteriia bacterium]